MISLKRWIGSIKITLVFYLPRKSRCNYRGKDTYIINITELLLLLYHTSMVDQSPVFRVKQYTHIVVSPKLNADFLAEKSWRSAKRLMNGENLATFVNLLYSVNLQKEPLKFRRNHEKTRWSGQLLGTVWIYFRPISYFHTPWKYQKTSGFLVFS